MKNGKDQCCAEKALGVGHTRIHLHPLTGGCHGEAMQPGNPMYLAVEVWIHQASAMVVCRERLCYRQTYLVGARLRDFLLSVISYLVQLLTSSKTAAAAQPSPRLPPCPLPAEEAQ